MTAAKSAGNRTPFLDLFRHFLTTYFGPGSGADPGDIQVYEAQSQPPKSSMELEKRHSI